MTPARQLKLTLPLCDVVILINELDEVINSDEIRLALHEPENGGNAARYFLIIEPVARPGLYFLKLQSDDGGSALLLTELAFQ